MDKQTIGLIVTITMVMAPVIGISFLMTAKSKKVRRRGFISLSVILFAFALAFFIYGITQNNKAGYPWMALMVGGSYWAWTKAKSQDL